MTEKGVIMIYTLLQILVSIFTMNLMAEVSTSKLKLNQNKNRYTLGTKLQAFPDLQTGSDIKSTNELFSLKLNRHWNINTPLKVDAELIWSASEKHLYHDIPELYASYQINKNNQIYLGRKNTHWSIEDQIWKRGLWTPRSYRQVTDMKMQSFFALYHASQLTPKITSTLMMSPLFVPDLGVPYEIKNGSFATKNPNFKPPATKINLAGNDVSISYDMIKDDPKNIIFHPSVAGKINYKLNTATQLSLQAAHKPMNQMVLEAPVIIGTLGRHKGFLHADIRPEVYYHSLLSAELNQNINKTTVWGLSVSDDHPNIKRRSKIFLQKDLDRSQIYSLYIRKNFEHSQTQALLSYTKLVGGDQADRGELTASNNSRFPARFDYYNAVKLLVKQKINFRRPMLIEAEFNYDFDQSTYVAKVDVVYNVFDRLNLSLNYTDVSLMSSDYSTKREHYWHGFLDVDSFGLGVNYAF